MLSDTFYSDHASVYPGEYEPFPRNEKFFWEQLNQRQREVRSPRVNINELNDYYRIEMFVPGFKREDFFIRINGKSLSIIALNSQINAITDVSALGTIHREIIKRDIDLPADIDSDFATAEYKNGVLNIFFYKTNNPNGEHSRRIIVY
ncbi:MAG TPA: Hsp20/alpha crystallin family protein [Puia sp.]|nr:Hsp20/alpha crystallin family protein [Puia sp.]